MSHPSRILLGIVAITLAFAAAARAADNTQHVFFQAVASGEAERLTQLMTPELAQAIDAPVLAVWMQAMNERLGSITAVSESRRTSQQTFVGLKVTTTAEVQFANGVASSSLSTLDGKLLAFDVRSAQLGDDWFRGPDSTQLYEQLGASLIRKIVANEADGAYALCHSAVRETVGREAFGELVRRIAENGGDVESITLQQSRMEQSDEGQILLLSYDVACRRASGTCEVKVQFIGLKGHLMGFNFR